MNDREALEKLRQGGRQRGAVQYLYRRYAPRFLTYFLRHRLTLRRAEALVQDAFVEIVLKSRDFFGETRADTWLWAIARNALLEHFRRSRPQEIADDHAFELLVEGEPAAAAAQAPAKTPEECARTAYAAFAAAYADRAEMLARVALDGWTLEDLSVALKRTPDATRVYVAQSRAKLNTYLEPCRELAR